jgi:hypothetical protein
MKTHIMWLTSINKETMDETWECPCGRIMIIHSWVPWKRTIIAPGDDNAIHSGGKGSLSVSFLEIEGGEK